MNDLSKKTESTIIILLTAVTSDNNIDENEITELHKILSDMGLEKNESLDETIKNYLRKPHYELRNHFSEALEFLKDEIPLSEKNEIIQYVLRIADADKTMHGSEVKMIAEILKKWAIE